MAPCRRMKKWMTNILDSSYCTFLLSLFATILSFADPVTDILTAWEYGREGHPIWFFAGLFFVVFPCWSFSYLMRAYGSFAENCLCGFTPFSYAWVMLKICWTNFKKCCWDDNTEVDQALLQHINVARLVEAVFEAAPQILIQLYAISVQQEPVKIIQMISVPVSFLSLAWAFTDFTNPYELDIFPDKNVKQKVVLFANYLFVLSSRLFAIAFFIVTVKWWSDFALMFHSVSILIVDICCCYTCYRETCGCKDWFSGMKPAYGKLLIHWIRDDMSPTIDRTNIRRKEYFKQKERMILLSNSLFVIENYTMILLFYSVSPFSNTWYSLPVTVCVCSFSVIGAVARVAHVRSQLTKEPNNNVNSPAQKNDDTAEV